MKLTSYYISQKKKEKEKGERQILQKEGKEKEQKENQYKQQIMWCGKFIYLIFFKIWQVTTYSFVI